MGYQITPLWVYCDIKQVNFQRALDSIRDAERQMNPAGEYPGGVASYLARQLSEQLSAAFVQFGWRPQFDRDGNIYSAEHVGISIGWSEALFSSLAPCIEDGSCVAILGEDQQAWKWNFKGGCMHRIEGRLVFDDDDDDDEEAETD